MSEETDAPQGGTEPEAVASVSTEVETISEATTEQQTDAVEVGQATDAGEETDAPKRVPWFQKRIDEVTRQKYDAQREADYWKGVAEGRGQANAPAPEQQSGPPQVDQFDDWEAYEEARIAYQVEKRLEAARQQERTQQALRTYEERVSQARTAIADFDEVAFNRSLPVTPLMAGVIRDLDHGPQVLYHLGSNPSEAQRIASLPEHLQAAALGRIEAALTAVKEPPKAVPTKQVPPPPPQTVNGLSSGIAKAPEDMTMAEYVAAAKAEGRI